MLQGFTFLTYIGPQISVKQRRFENRTQVLITAITMVAIARIRVTAVRRRRLQGMLHLSYMGPAGLYKAIISLQIH